MEPSSGLGQWHHGRHSLWAPSVRGRGVKVVVGPASLNSMHCCSVTTIVVQGCPILCHPLSAALQASLSFTISWSLLKLMSIELGMPSNLLILHQFLRRGKSNSRTNYSSLRYSVKICNSSFYSPF